MTDDVDGKLPDATRCVELIGYVGQAGVVRQPIEAVAQIQAEAVADCHGEHVGEHGMLAASLNAVDEHQRHHVSDRSKHDEQGRNEGLEGPCRLEFDHILQCTLQGFLAWNVEEPGVAGLQSHVRGEHRGW